MATIELTTLVSKTDHNTTFTVIRLRKFQEIARDLITNDCVNHLQSSPEEERVFCLQAPTGAGKTIMISKMIKQINDQMNGNVAFVWLTIGDGGLTDQSKDALVKYLNRTGMNIYSLEEALIACPNSMAGNVVVINWESLNKEDKDGNSLNIAMKDGEKINFPQMCENTRNLCPIVLIIDESHTHAETEKSKHIRQTIITPIYTILSSATPISIGDQIHRIPYKEVAKAGLIKNHIATQEFVTHKDGIVMAAIKLKVLIALAKTCGAAYSPKMLVFVPNVDKNGKNGEVEDILVILKDQFNWDEASGDVKIWFSGAKDTDACKENFNTTKVIITKEAINTGIDIPSIQVIVQLRPTGKARVEIQKIGRGMRMPEQHHYGNDLDTLSIFAFAGFKNRIDWNGAEFYREEIEKSEIKIRPCFQSSVDKFPLVKAYRAERLDSFIESDSDTFSDEFYPLFKKKIEDHKDMFDISSDYKEILTTGSLHLDEKTVEELSQVKHTADESDIGILYSIKMKGALKHLHKHLPCIEKAIHDGKNLNGKRKDKQTFILNNLPIINRLIDESVRVCQTNQNDSKVVEFIFTPCKKYSFNGVVTNLTPNSKFLYDKMYVDRVAKKSRIESSFEEYIDAHSKVEFISRNFDRHDGSFSVVYIGKDDKQHNFFPDFVIKLVDGRWLIVDTKGHDPEEEVKKLALIASLTGTNIIGGIIKVRGTNFYIDYGHGEESFDDFIAK